MEVTLRSSMVCWLLLPVAAAVMAVYAVSQLPDFVVRPVPQWAESVEGGRFIRPLPLSSGARAWTITDSSIELRDRAGKVTHAEPLPARPLKVSRVLFETEIGSRIPHLYITGRHRQHLWVGRFSCQQGKTQSDWTRELNDQLIPQHQLAVDVDGDGRHELVIAGRRGSLLCFNATGSLRWRHRIDSGSSALVAGLAAVQSGRTRIALVRSSGRVELYEADGGLVASVETGRSIIAVSSVRIGQRVDLFLVSQSGPIVRLGGPGFSPAVLPRVKPAGTPTQIMGTTVLGPAVLLREGPRTVEWLEIAHGTQARITVKEGITAMAEVKTPGHGPGWIALGTRDGTVLLYDTKGRRCGRISAGTSEIIELTGISDRLLTMTPREVRSFQVTVQRSHKERWYVAIVLICAVLYLAVRRTLRDSSKRPLA